MVRKIITSFFTNNGVPTVGLSPTIQIWELHPTNPLINTSVVTGDPMVEIGGGWYRYDFLTYDIAKNYTFTTDGGGTLPTFERYSTAVNESYQEDVVSAVLDEDATSHIIPGSVGLVIQQTHANTVTTLTTCITNMTQVLAMLEELLKYDMNRTKLDKIAKTLTVYDDDQVTPIRVFNLKDSNGLPSVLEVCERVPV